MQKQQQQPLQVLLRLRVMVKLHITPNEENIDFIVNDITLELNDVALELSDGDITDIYEAAGDD